MTKDEKLAAIRTWFEGLIHRRDNAFKVAGQSGFNLQQNLHMLEGYLDSAESVLEMVSLKISNEKA